MNLYSINTGLFKLDGGAMFGVVPQSIWKTLNPPDANNMCTWAMRCLLVQHDNRLVLIDNGIGNKQDAKFFGHYYLHGEDTLEKSIHALGFDFKDITDVFLTHLHFDHCGGSIQWNKDHTAFEPAFPSATYWSHAAHWEWAVKPNPREKASFLKENILPIQESGHLKFLNDGDQLFEGFSVKCVDGHTEKMMIPHISYKGKTLIYCADLFPSSYHIPIPYVMAYDVRPLISLKEKEEILKSALENNSVLFFEHDPKVECARVLMTDKGIRISETFALSDI